MSKSDIVIGTHNQSSGQEYRPLTIEEVQAIYGDEWTMFSQVGNDEVENAEWLALDNHIERNKYLNMEWEELKKIGLIRDDMKFEQYLLAIGVDQFGTSLEDRFSDNQITDVDLDLKGQPSDISESVIEIYDEIVIGEEKYNVLYANENGKLEVIDNSGDVLAAQISDDGSIDITSFDGAPDDLANVVPHGMTDEDLLEAGYSSTALSKSIKYDEMQLNNMKAVIDGKVVSIGDHTKIYDMDEYFKGNKIENGIMKDHGFLIPSGSVVIGMKQIHGTVNAIRSNRSIQFPVNYKYPEGTGDTYKRHRLKIPKDVTNNMMFEMIVNPCYSVTFEAELPGKKTYEGGVAVPGEPLKVKVFYNTLRETMTDELWDIVNKNPDWVVIFGDEINFPTDNINIKGNKKLSSSAQVKTAISIYNSAINNFDWNSSSSAYHKGQGGSNNTYLEYFHTSHPRGQSYKYLKSINDNFRRKDYKYGGDYKNQRRGDW